MHSYFYFHFWVSPVSIKNSFWRKGCLAITPDLDAKMLRSKATNALSALNVEMVWNKL
jgi:hypothetical protein